ncbi:transcriptional regulator [Deltaproteobacteria bacterium]|nr:transcriptional regulator [Deltaproteobacteria bacterium]
MITHRQNLMELLSQGTFTLQDLSVEMRLSMKEVLHHLKHVRKSVRPPFGFIIEPAGCLNCGFVFKEREKLHSPGKCPMCRSSHISEPAYRIE